MSSSDLHPPSVLAAGHAADEAAKLAALRRTKAVATFMLVLCVAIFAAAKSLEHRWPLLGFVAAFAEAATIGGIADWYAVVALFKRPLGLPIPHTAIIPENQNRIADNLGRFIEVEFPRRAAGAQETQRGRFRRAGRRLAVRSAIAPPACRVSSPGWCRRRCRRSRIRPARFHHPAACSTRSRRCRSRRSPPNCLSAFTEDRRHQKLFDELTRVLGKFLNDEEALDAMRDKIRDGTAVAVQAVPRRRLSVEEDRRLGRLVAGGGAQGPGAPDAGRVRPLRDEIHRTAAQFATTTPSAPRR